MSSHIFKFLAQTEVEWLEDQYDKMRRRLLVPSVREMASHYFNTYRSREIHHEVAGTTTDVEVEIEKVISAIQARERRQPVA